METVITIIGACIATPFVMWAIHKWGAVLDPEYEQWLKEYRQWENERED